MNEWLIYVLKKYLHHPEIGRALTSWDKKSSQNKISEFIKGATQKPKKFERPLFGSKMTKNTIIQCNIIIVAQVTLLGIAWNQNVP